MRLLPLTLLACSFACTTAASESGTDTDSDGSSSSSSSESSSSESSSSGSSSTGPLLCEGGDLLIPSGNPISIDGGYETLEWNGAERVEIPVQATSVEVRLQHDGENLQVAFSPLASGGLVLFAEIYVDVQGDKTPMFGADDWWFHANDQQCGTMGAFDAWDTCTDDNPDWDHNIGFTGPADVVEFSIPFATLGIDPEQQCTFGLALRVTNTQTVAEMWPFIAARDEPVTWATVDLAPVDGTSGSSTGGSSSGGTTSGTTSGSTSS